MQCFHLWQILAWIVGTASHSEPHLMKLSQSSSSSMMELFGRLSNIKLKLKINIATNADKDVPKVVIEVKKFETF